jgi:hypothetical protein
VPDALIAVSRFSSKGGGSLEWVESMGSAAAVQRCAEWVQAFKDPQSK